MEKRKVTERIELYDFNYSSASTVIKILQDLIAEYGEGDIWIQDQYEGCVYVYFEYQRDETDEEYQVRIEKEKQIRSKEFEQYQRLKAKFEGKE